MGSICPEDVVIIPAFGTTRDWNPLCSTKVLKCRSTTPRPFVEKSGIVQRSSAKKIIRLLFTGNRSMKKRVQHFRTAQVTVHRWSYVTWKKRADSRKYITDSKSKKNFIRNLPADIPKTLILRKICGAWCLNQTTMLATETQPLLITSSRLWWPGMVSKAWREHFADTRDTLCYATNDNQDATYRLLETDADLAIVVGRL